MKVVRKGISGEYGECFIQWLPENPVLAILISLSLQVVLTPLGNLLKPVLHVPPYS